MGEENKIHPTAIIHPNARIGKNVEIGPYVIIERKCANLRQSTAPAVRKRKRVSAMTVC